MIKKGVKDLVEEAEANIETMTVQEVIKIQRDDNNTMLVDIRDIRELWRDGTIPNSIHAPRGMLEFWVDPNSPYYREQFGSGKKNYILLCRWAAFRASGFHGQKNGVRSCSTHGRWIC